MVTHITGNAERLMASANGKIFEDVSTDRDFLQGVTVYRCPQCEVMRAFNSLALDRDEIRYMLDRFCECSPLR